MIVLFPSMPYVKLTSAEITVTRLISATGISVTHHATPKRTFFLELCEDGGCSCVWDGETYEDALRAARCWAADGVAVRDHIVSSARRA